MGAVNLEIFRAINGWSDSFSPFLTFFSVALNQIWVKVALGLLLLGMLWRNERTRQTVIQALIAVALGNTLTDQFKHFLPMNRPYQDFHDVINRVGTSDSHGTASAHSANMAAVAFIFAYNLRWWGSPWVAVALLTGISRIYVGAHYPYQVLLGWSTGLISAFAVAKVWEGIQRKRNPVIEGGAPDAIAKET